MRWAYRIGRIAGTDIKVHFTFVLLLAWAAYDGYLAGGARVALLETFFLVALFGCIVLHEFGHIAMARRFGVTTPDIVLLPIGGVARLQRLPEEPKQEFLIALAGPAVTLLIILVLAALVLLGGNSPAFGTRGFNAPSLAVRLLAVNVYLLLFNLIPAFPMDGGRVLRAVLAHRLGLPRATRIAAQVGKLLAIAMGAIGLFGFPALGMGPNFLLVLIAVFVMIGASTEERMVETRAFGRGVSVAQMMVTDFRTIPVHATLGQAAELLLTTEQREFPVVDNLGRVEGLLTRDGLIRGLAHRGNGAIVAEAMAPQTPVVSPTLEFEQALATLRASGLPALPVIDAGGALVGLLTADNIADLLLVRRARGEV